MSFLRNRNRLVTNIRKKNQRTCGFVPYASHAGSYVDYAGYVMYVGYKDFPQPDDL
jgi:hypothetical protein